VSVAFYTIGLGEAVANTVGSDSESLPRIIAAVTIVGLLGLAWLGADIATRFQYVVLGCLIVAIGAYFVGVVGDLDPGLASENMWTPPGGGSFWVSFAIFFPAVTGFTQGVAMSGDLETPSRSISIGTFGAIGVSTIVYVAVIVTMAMTVPLAELEQDTTIIRRLALTPWLIDVGVIAATLSSAIASIMGAPRTLQRLAADRLVKPLEPFAVGAGADDNPRRGVVLTAAIALVTVAFADLDLVAPIISMFFLASYGMLNYATYFEARAASTSFRPRFRFFDWRLSLAGTLACLGVILAIDPIAGTLAGLAVLALYRYLRKSATAVRWADSTRGFHTSEVRSHLKLMGVKGDPGRDWRPCTVAFAPRDPTRRARLATVASWLEGGAGFTTVARIIPGKGAVLRKQAQRVEVELQRELATAQSMVYGRVIVSETLEGGVASMIQAHGIGALRANLALFSWYDLEDPDRPNARTYGTMLQTSIRYGCNVAIMHATTESWAQIPKNSKHTAKIAVWWHEDRTGELMTLLAWMCTRQSDWHGAEIDVWVVNDSPSDEHMNQISARLDEARLPAKVVGSARQKDFAATISYAQLVFAPVRVHKGEPLGPNQTPIDDLITTSPVVVFTHAAAPVELDLQPDDASSAMLAVAQDRAMELTARADELSQKAGTLMVAAEMLRIESNSEDEEFMQASAAATAAHRKYLAARSRAETAWRKVEEIDPTLADISLDPGMWIGDETSAPKRPRH
jgi:hypothetical protein